MDGILKVIDAAASRLLTDRTTVKTVLGITTSTDDSLLDLLIKQASAAAESYCNRVFALEAVEQTFRRVIGFDFVILRRRPVVGIVSITEDGFALAESEYEIDQDKGFLYRLDGNDGRTKWCANKLVVRYDAGYVLPDSPSSRTLPEDLEAGVIELIKAVYLSRKRDPGLKREYVPGVAEYEFFQADVATGKLPISATDKLDFYRDTPV